VERAKKKKKEKKKEKKREKKTTACFFYLLWVTVGVHIFHRATSSSKKCCLLQFLFRFLIFLFLSLLRPSLALFSPPRPFPCILILADCPLVPLRHPLVRPLLHNEKKGKKKKTKKKPPTFPTYSIWTLAARSRCLSVTNCCLRRPSLFRMQLCRLFFPFFPPFSPLFFRLLIKRLLRMRTPLCRRAAERVPLLTDCPTPRPEERKKKQKKTKKKEKKNEIIDVALGL
jgi:hypothetical protein